MTAQHARHTLSARGLACVRGDRCVFEGLGFELENGGLLQVSGPNGSGKTSLLRIVCGLLQPGAGEIQWNSRDVRRLGDDYSRNLAYIGHLNGVKDDLDVFENLQFAARIAGLPAEPEAVRLALREFAFGGSEHLPSKVLSQGQKRRLALARLRLSTSRVLWVLDEPFAALDTAGIAVIRRVLEEHLRDGGLALLTTHQEVAIAAPGIQRLELRA